MRLALLSILFVTIFSGCVDKQVVIKYKWKKQLVTVPCRVRDVNCSIKADDNDAAVVAKMYACILKMREEAKVCR